MDAEIVAIGTELLWGVTVDTNSAYLAGQLGTIGVLVRRVTLIGDDLDAIVGVLRAAMDRVPLVICSGGLGPTGDDLTREAIARATEQPLVFHQTLLDDIAARFAAFKRAMSDSNRQQAFVPRGSHIIRNPRGTAPAFVAHRNGHAIAALPGVPQELKHLTEHALLPYLREHFGLNEVLLVREVRVSGLTEAEAGERIADIMLGENPTVGITAKRGQHTIRIAARAASNAAAEAVIASRVALIEQRFAGHVLGEETLEDRVGRLLVERGVRLQLIENDIAASVFRALTKTESGQQSLYDVMIKPDAPISQDSYSARARLLSTLGLDRGACLVALREPGNGTFSTLHIALRLGAENSVKYVSRGIDFGLPHAHDFVATTALELLRQSLESDPPVAPAS